MWRTEISFVYTVVVIRRSSSSSRRIGVVQYVIYRVVEGSWAECDLVGEGSVVVSELDAVLHVRLVHGGEPFIGEVLGPPPGRHHMRGSHHMILEWEL